MVLFVQVLNPIQICFFAFHFLKGMKTQGNPIKKKISKIANQFMALSLNVVLVNQGIC